MRIWSVDCYSKSRMYNIRIFRSADVKLGQSCVIWVTESSDLRYCTILRYWQRLEVKATSVDVILSQEGALLWGCQYVGEYSVLVHLTYCNVA